MQPTFPDYIPTVPQLLAAGRSRFADRDAVVTPSDRISYADLDDMSRRLAAGLLEAGVGKGSRVAILFPNGIEWVLAWTAAARIGAVAIPVNTFYKAPELAAFMRHADVQHLVGVASFIQHDYIERLESVAPELRDHRGGPIRIDSLPQLRQVLLWDESPRDWARGGLRHALDNPAEPVVAGIVDALGHDVSPGDELIVTYTSGSTGEPKGVVHSHGGVIRQAANLSAMAGIDETSRVWTPMPLCWVGGFAFSLARALVSGGCFATQAVFEPGEALKMFARERITNVAAWPAVAKTLQEHPDFAGTDLTSLRSPASFYDAMPVDRKPPDPGLAVGSLGMSETCGPHTFWYAGEETTGVPEEYRGAFGHEVPGTEHRIIDPESGEDMPQGTEGEVLVRGYNLMLGLYKRERSEVFEADGWYRTGDRGYFRDGWFFFTGRQSDLIKTGGSNVAPAEVEACLLRFPSVKLAFVVGVPDEVRGQQVVALVVAWAGEEIDLAGLSSSLREDLSSYKIPARILVIDEPSVPWLVSQKVDRRSLVTLAEKLLADRARQ